MNTVNRRALAVAAATGLAAVGLAMTAPTAHADTTTITSSVPIAIPASGGVGPGSPYPSGIEVLGMAGSVSTVRASIANFSHGSAADVDLLLVAPDGSNLLLMSDLRDDGLTMANNASLVFDDAAPTSVPSTLMIPSGTYKPTNFGGGDTFPAPAPTPSGHTTFSAAFTGVPPNGLWRLYAVDDTSGDSGSVAGWSLSVTTVAAAPTSTVVVASPNPATTGQSVTLTASVTASGSPVTAGTVTFTDGATTIAANVPLDASGQASTSTASLTEDSHAITATYSGSAGLLSSNGTTTEVVDSPTQVSGSTYCNNGGLTVPSIGVATPYASHISVSGLAGTPTSVEASLAGVTHGIPKDLDVLLVGPGGQKVELLSDVGGASPVSGLTLNFADGNPAVPLGSLASGTYAPTNDDVDAGGPDTFPAPAPAGAPATTMSAFSSSSPNGTWSLFVVDDAGGDAGSIGSWCLSIQSQAPTSTALAAQPHRGPNGTSVTFTATVTSGGSPVTDGSVSFYDVTRGGHVLLGSQGVNGSGEAAITSASLVGRHLVQAEYGATATHAGSASNTVVVRILPVADAGGPYVISPGDSLHLDASGSTVNGTTRVRWDVNGDGNFGDATGVSPTLTWSQLQGLGIQPGHTYKVRVKVKTNDVAATDRTNLTVTS